MQIMEPETYNTQPKVSSTLSPPEEEPEEDEPSYY